MIDTLIICITVLVIAAGVYHFLSRYLDTRPEVEKLRADIEEFKELAKQDVNTLAQNDQKLEAAITGIKNVIAGPGTDRKGNISRILDNFEKSRANKS